MEIALIVLQKPVIKKPGTTLGELENSVYSSGGPRGVNTPSSEPQTKGLQSFYRDYSGQHWLLIGWFKLRGFVHAGTAVKMGRGMPDLYMDRHD